MHIEPTTNHSALAAAVNSRINADARILNAKAAMWRLFGLGVLGALLGAGVGAAFYGYSYIHDVTNTAERMAGAIGKALERTSISGEVKLAQDQSVKLDPQAEVTLKDGSKVGVDGSVALKDGAVVRLDPNAKVGVTGTVVLNGDIPRPTENQFRGSSPTPRPANVVRNYTIFTLVPFGTGNVVTGWMFETSEQAVPTKQYCYFGVPVEDAVQVRVELAIDGVAIPMKKPNGLDVNTAMAQCSWYDGSMTRRTAAEMPQAQSPNLRRTPGIPVDNWCRKVYPEAIQSWCIHEFGLNGTFGKGMGKAY
ncbi:hypothetical protein [Microvirga sp. 2TAF3]|uniref:hypothetical protein n=1 Tax=Microvirga sp. 2TAF3 TaxID=3233014 RepID=UPI003F970668